ncbi:hypothetical protein FM037_22635 [Shewanella psychropiezotolerans]|uniref:DUF5610 domain-containing protein n=1 Tax=Shewanella psychropiezotolerans TaxID=2593655 RepID=A0ABX5X2X6_9GAMM|nr:MULTISPECIES: DUF5610 domain-containing protein [Shewanella]MPY23466.1 hypothetical protein [Shewanella sp. YLB-07]QDO85546.1 hypothetical protein FM037_22635 [Shewanella psychropiezotolerans]
MEINTHGTEVSRVARDKSDSTDNHGKNVSDIARKETAFATSKHLMNTAIISAQQEVNLSSSDEPMILLYRAAIEAINEELAPTMGENALQTAYANGIDTSPEATAERIVSFATQFFSLHQGQNANMGFDEQLDSFMEIIGGAIDKGFGEAREILKGLQVLEGDIADGVDQTYSLVQEGLQEFRDSFNQLDETEDA